MAAGLTNPQIDERLLRSRATVKTHVGDVFIKLGVENRSQVTAIAVKHEMVPKTVSGDGGSKAETAGQLSGRVEFPDESNGALLDEGVAVLVGEVPS